ncbi:AarF/ABC1/UbiB kinase family protein [Altererythrobacter aquiaggeris]|uniref:ABC1 kinase family protein n=1 Tax=Aestuarierythrobacter aquiaggeris TaxID=1898396 RepID=UPI00301A6398
MSNDKAERRQRAVPSGRLSRLSTFGRLAGGLAGGMLAEGSRRLASGEIPRINDMILTPGNAMRLADRLSHLRGAAMKLGQMISMDAGDMLPPELSGILATLRDNANFMPARQLDKVLIAEWGPDWRSRFKRFEPRPVAAASIGQVHRAVTRGGETLAIKVQYPGIRESIDADVDNVATLLRMSGMLPAELDFGPLLKAAKEQLHEEADYVREGEQLQRYAALLADRPEFVVPTLDRSFTGERILAMSFEPGVPIESLESAPQDIRDRVSGQIIELVGRELFEFGVMQTDPNFANYRYQPETGRIVLLDFGAARDVSPQIAGSYRRLLVAGLAGDRDAVRDAAVTAGFVNPAAIRNHRDRIDTMIDVILGEMTRDDVFDFGDRAFVTVLRDEGMAIAEDRSSWHLPPAETLFIQRKVSGTALLGARLKAKVDVRGIVSRILDANPVMTT